MKTTIYRIVTIDNEYNYNVIRMENEFYSTEAKAIAAVEENLKHCHYDKVEDWHKDLNRHPWQDVRTQAEGWRVARLLKKVTWTNDFLTHKTTVSQIYGIMGYYMK